MEEKVYNTTEVKKLFLNFLKTNHAYCGYKRGFINYMLRTKSSVNKYIIDNSMFSEPHSLISCKMIWGMTEEGVSFWCTLHQKWQKVLEENKSKIHGKGI